MVTAWGAKNGESRRSEEKGGVTAALTHTQASGVRGDRSRDEMENTAAQAHSAWRVCELKGGGDDLWPRKTWTKSSISGGIICAETMRIF